MVIKNKKIIKNNLEQKKAEIKLDFSFFCNQLQKISTLSFLLYVFCLKVCVQELLFSGD